jgi:hypothetical protein
MLFQAIDINKYIPFIIAGVLLGCGVIILKVALAVTKAESKTNMKWIAGSFFIQFGVILFISTPMLFDMFLHPNFGKPNFVYPMPPSLIAMIVIFSIFVVVNLINTIHKPGIIRSFIITLLILGPIIVSSYLIFNNIGSVL